jgi:hypothetical protein
MMDTDTPVKRTPEESAKLKAGKIISVEHGEYGDHCFMGFFVVKTEFDHAAELEEYLVAHPEQRVDYKFKEHQFLTVLIAKGLLQEIELDTLYLGSYGRGGCGLHTKNAGVELISSATIMSRHNIGRCLPDDDDVVEQAE